MGRHKDGRRIPLIITVVSVALAALAGVLVALALISGGNASQAAIPLAPFVPPVSPPPPTSSVTHENHVATALSTPAGQIAQAHSDQVTRDRQLAAGDPLAVATQSRIDQLGGPVMFGPDTASLSPDGEAQVARTVDVLRADPTARVEVVGHTAVEISDPPLCLQLSQLRAEQVALRVEGAGIEPNRVSAIGVSHTQAKDSAAESRRVELVVLAH